MAAATLALLSDNAHAWGMHSWITKAAVPCLPEWQQELMGTNTKPFIDEYCSIPDWVYSRKDLAPFAMRDAKPGVLYHPNLHLPPDQKEMFDICSYFFGRAVDAWRAGKQEDAWKYLGTLSHAVEDWGCPAHTIPGDNQFNFMRQLLPPPDDHRYKLIHGPMEGGTFSVDIEGYRPSLLGTGVSEIAYRLVQRSIEGVIHARAQVIPIMQALYADDKKAVSSAQQVAADFDAKVVADMVYSFLCLVSDRIPAAEAEALKHVDLSRVQPLEATHFYVPQSMFFSKPYWGQAHRGVHLRKGRSANLVPLKLVVDRDGQKSEETFPDGIGTGTHSVYSYLVPPGAYTRLEAWAGVQPGIDGKGSVIFQVAADGKVMEEVGPLSADMPAHRFSVPLGSAGKIRLIAKGGDGKAAAGNYAVWGRPRFVK